MRTFLATTRSQIKEVVDLIEKADDTIYGKDGQSSSRHLVEDLLYQLRLTEETLSVWSTFSPQAARSYVQVAMTCVDLATYRYQIINTFITLSSKLPPQGKEVAELNKVLTQGASLLQGALESWDRVCNPAVSAQDVAASLLNDRALQAYLSRKESTYALLRSLT